MSARKLRPIGKRLLVEPLPAADKSAGGIMMPETYKLPSGRAKVVAVGAKVEDIRPGDRVIYSWINGIPVEHEDRTLRLLQLEEILGVEHA